LRGFVGDRGSISVEVSNYNSHRRDSPKEMIGGTTHHNEGIQVKLEYTGIKSGEEVLSTVKDVVRDHYAHWDLSRSMPQEVNPLVTRKDDGYEHPNRK